MRRSKLHTTTITALVAALFILPFPVHATEVAIFPSLNIAKTAYKNENYTLAAQHWMPLAHKGNTQAQVGLGKLYTKGLGVQKNNKTALNLFLSAAEQKNPRAMFEIGRLYEKGDAVEKNYTKAKEWYELAAVNGYARGNYAIGNMHEKNKFSKPVDVNTDTKSNIKTAINNIKNRQYQDASYLAAIYEQGKGVPQNYQKALTYYLVAQNSKTQNTESKISLLESKISLDQYIQAKKDSDLLMSDNKTLKEPRKNLIRHLKRTPKPSIPPEQAEHNQNLALKYYKTSAEQGYQRAKNKISIISGDSIEENEETQKVQKAKTKKKYKIITDLKTQFVGEENLDLGTRNNDTETSLVLNGKIGAYLYPTEHITSYVEVRGLYTEGVASSDNDNDDDSADTSFAELRQAWVEFDQLFGIDPASLKLGRQRFYETRGLWWNRDLDAARLAIKSDITNGFIAVGENQSVYRIGSDNELDRDDEDRLRVLGELSHQYAPSHIIEGRFLYEDDHSDTAAIGSNIEVNDRDTEDLNVLWSGVRAQGQFIPSQSTLAQISYRADIIGVAGEETITSTTNGPSSDLRTVTAINDRDVLGWAFDGSIDFLLDHTLEPTLTLAYAYGSGDDGSGDNNAFRQSDLDGNTSLFPKNRVSSPLRNYGEVLRPELSNIHIANAGLNFPVLKTSDVNINYFSYWLDEESTGLRSSQITAPLNGQDNYLGQALDISTNINIGKEMNLQSPLLKNSALRIKLGGFEAGDAYGAEDGEYAYRGSTELRIKF